MKEDKCYVCGRGVPQIQDYMARSVQPMVTVLEEAIAGRREEDKKWSDSIHAQLNDALPRVAATAETVRGLKWTTAQSDPAILGPDYPFDTAKSALHHAGKPIEHEDTIGDVLDKLSSCIDTHVGNGGIQRQISRMEAELEVLERDVSPQNAVVALVDFELPLAHTFGDFERGTVEVTLCRVCAGLRDEDIRRATRRREDAERMANDW